MIFDGDCKSCAYKVEVCLEVKGKRYENNGIVWLDKDTGLYTHLSLTPLDKEKVM